MKAVLCIIPQLPPYTSRTIRCDHQSSFTSPQISTCKTPPTVGAPTYGISWFLCVFWVYAETDAYYYCIYFVYYYYDRLRWTTYDVWLVAVFGKGFGVLYYYWRNCIFQFNFFNSSASLLELMQNSNRNSCIFNRWNLVLVVWEGVELSHVMMWW